MSKSTKDEGRGALSSSDEDADLARARAVDDTYDALKVAHIQVQQAQCSKSNRALTRAGDLCDATKDAMAVTKDIEAAIEPAIQSDLLKAIGERITTFADCLPGVLKALDEVANIHPFLKVAVSAFRIVVELDEKRRDNDKKIIVLFIEMKDMMEALIQLRDIKDEDTSGPDGATIKARLQELVERTAVDIKECANMCDTYAKKRLLVKVIKSSSWDEKFKAFLALFAGRQREFIQALTIHMGKAVDDVRRKMDSMDAKLAVLVANFPMFVSTEQEQLRDAVESRGGPEVVKKDDRALVSLARFKSPTSGGPIAKHPDPSRQEWGGDDDLRLLKEELNGSIDIVVQKNMDVFMRKFTAQQQQQIDSMQGVVQHESDRVIDRVLSGPHERIKDRIIYEIWKDMRWRGHAKARHFVLALRDHYLDHWPEHTQGGDSSEDRANLWAIDHIDVNNISAIAEACDADASGFITIIEVNTFTTLRPRLWSLLQWLAWWSAGWKISLAAYAHKIDILLEEMIMLLPTIRAENRALALRYLNTVWEGVAQLTRPFHDFRVSNNEELPSCFADHVEAEERCLDESLKQFRYTIDASNTLSLIIWRTRGRIETVLIPLLYLLVRRHIHIFRLCQSKVVIHHAELETCAESVLFVLNAAYDRCDSLEHIYKQRNIDPKRQFNNFACGLFDYWYNQEENWTIKNIMDEYASEDSDYGLNSTYHVPSDPQPSMDVLNYPTALEATDTGQQDSLTAKDLRATGIRADMLGQWYGFFAAVGGSWPAFPGMFSFFLHDIHDIYDIYDIHDRNEDLNIIGTNAVTADGVPYWIFVGITLVPVVGSGSHIISRLIFGDLGMQWSLTGVLAEDKRSISGTWRLKREGDEALAEEEHFYFTRLAPEILVARPSPTEFDASRVGALWSFLRAYVRQRFQVRLSWRHIKDFVSRRKRCIDLLMKSAEKEEDWEFAKAEEYADEDEDEDEDELVQLMRSFTFDQISLCYRIRDIKRRASVSLCLDQCEACGGSGPRYTCIPCSLELDRPFVFCNDPECRETAFGPSEVMHHPAHNMIKLRRPTLSHHDFPHLFRLAKSPNVWRAVWILRRALESELRADTKLSGQEDENVMSGIRPVIPVPKHTGLSTEDLDADATSKAADNDLGKSWTETDTGGDPLRNPSRIFKSKGISSRRKRPVTPIPSCVSCHREVRCPCMLCIECEGTELIFVCEGCDAKPEGVSAGKHLATHTLVPCESPSSPSETKQTSGEADERFRALLDSQAAHSRQITALDERMARIEGLLQALVATGAGRGDAAVVET